jgi:urease accessory protein
MGQWEGHTHQATFTIIHPGINIKFCMQAISQMLEKEKDIMYGLSNPVPNGIIVRILGFKGEQLYKCFGEIAHLFNYNSLKNGLYVK